MSSESELRIHLKTAQARVAVLENRDIKWSLDRAVLETNISNLNEGRRSDVERITDLENVHAAACAHLVAMGRCDGLDEMHEHEHHCGSECTYCDLNAIVSAVEERP